MIGARVMVDMEFNCSTIQADKPKMFVSRHGSLFALQIVILFSLLAISPAAKANDIYVSQSGGGVGSGCANALPESFFNNASNWGTGASQIGPGTTVHICGIITGSAGATLFTFQGSGTPGAPITLFFEPGAVLQAPYFAASSGGGCGGAICMSTFYAGRSYVVVDGGTNGVIQNTANGDSQANQQQSEGIAAWDCTNCVIKGVTISNIYVHHSGGSTSIDQTRVRCVEFSGANWQISGNTMHDAGWCLFHGYSHDSNIQIYGNNIYNFDHGWAFMGGNGNTASGVYFHDNRIHDTANWDASGCPFHHDGIHAFGVSSTPLNNASGLYVYNNYFYGNWGSCQTGQVFIEAGSSDANLQDGHFWNNIFIEGPGSSPDFTGMFGFFSGHAGPSEIYNNTCVYLNTTDGTTCMAISNIKGLKFKNNLMTNVNNPISINNSSFSSGDVDYNFYGAGGSLSNWFRWSGSFTGSLSAWRSACNCDAHALQNSSPQLNADGSPTSTSPIKGVAGNLSLIAIGNLLSMQMDTSEGNVRTPVARPLASLLTGWDAGAYSVASSGSAPAPPTGLAASAQ